MISISVARNVIGSRMENRIGNAAVALYGIRFLRERDVPVAAKSGNIRNAYSMQAAAQLTVCISTGIEDWIIL